MARKSILYRVVLSLIIPSLSFGLLGFSESQEDIQTSDRISNYWKTQEGELTTPELIEEAFLKGEVSFGERTLYLAYAVYEYESLPVRFRSNKPWFGSQEVLELREAYLEIKDGQVLHLSKTDANEFERVMAPTGIYCDRSNLPHSLTSAHFQINANVNGIGGGLTINDYTAALDATFAKEVSSYGWPEPPYNAANSAKLYPVQVASLGGGLYGYVTAWNATYTGFIGNNPHTAAVETAAYASCMVLNSDYGGFPSGALGSLQATAAHEFVHAISLGWAIRVHPKIQCGLNLLLPTLKMKSSTAWMTITIIYGPPLLTAWATGLKMG